MPIGNGWGGTAALLQRLLVRTCRTRLLGAIVGAITFLAIFVVSTTLQWSDGKPSEPWSPLGMVVYEPNETAIQAIDFSNAPWYQNHKRFSYEFEEVQSPSGSFDRLEYLIVVTSALQNFASRALIRKTWGAKLKAMSDSKLVFLLGVSSDRELRKQIRRESSIHGDLMQSSFEDSYENLTTKSIVMLKWSRRFKPTFLVKIDDDVMLNIETLRRTTASLHAQSRKFIAGLAFFDAKPMRWWWDKFYITKEEYADEIFPAYTAGLLYVITGNLIEDLYKEALETPPIRFEDIYVTGFLATKLAIPRIGLRGIDLFEENRDCDIHNMLAVHLSVLERMQKLQHVLDQTVRICGSWMLGKYCDCRKKSTKPSHFDPVPS